MFGLGGSGLASASALLAGGADVVAWDDNADTVAQGDRRPAFRPPTCAISTGRRSQRWCSRPACRSRIRRRIGPWGWRARPRVEVIGDIELFCRERRRNAPDAPFVAITGTNGKSTTTALIAHLLRSAGHDVQIGGNIGTAILSLEPPRQRTRSRHRGLVLPDRSRALARSVGRHPDQRHRGPSRPPRHACALCRGQGAAGRRRAGGRHRHRRRRRQLVPGGGRPHRARRQARACVSRCAVRLPTGSMSRPGRSCWPTGGAAQRSRILGGIGSLRGAHNAQNAACASGAALALGMTAAQIQDGLALVSRARAPHGAGRPQGPRAVRQRLQGDQRRFGGAGAGLLRRHLLDRRRQAEDRRHRRRSPASSRASARPI